MNGPAAGPPAADRPAPAGDLPTAEAVLPLLGDCPIGRPYTFVPTGGSTNLLLRRLAAQGAP
ncbi:MAG: hypothetical protein DIU84_06665 [Bacillota bacterium]|nr:MAG: hypothetical protein DIU84_06665 [Bacillota bacterium]